MYLGKFSSYFQSTCMYDSTPLHQVDLLSARQDLWETNNFTFNTGLGLKVGLKVGVKGTSGRMWLS
jgi:hypothetical protein